jgi:hypothetical protein
VGWGRRSGGWARVWCWGGGGGEGSGGPLVGLEAPWSSATAGRELRGGVRPGGGGGGDVRWSCGAGDSEARGAASTLPAQHRVRVWARAVAARVQKVPGARLLFLSRPWIRCGGSCGEGGTGPASWTFLCTRAHARRTRTPARRPKCTHAAFVLAAKARGGPGQGLTPEDPYLTPEARGAGARSGRRDSPYLAALTAEPAPHGGPGSRPSRPGARRREQSVPRSSVHEGWGRLETCLCARSGLEATSSVCTWAVPHIDAPGLAKARGAQRYNLHLTPEARGAGARRGRRERLPFRQTQHLTGTAAQDHARGSSQYHAVACRRR